MATHHTKIIALITVLIFIMSSCKKQNFTPLETQNIEQLDGSDSIMRLYTVDNAEDSVILRAKARPIKPSFDESTIEQLRQRMLATVKDPENSGVGIAAPQVGISVQLICVQRLDKTESPFEFYINPEITTSSNEKKPGAEGCLSIPNERGFVNRSTQIEINYLDASFQQQNETVSGFTAVIFQHEIDHLNGILFTDKLTIEE